MLTKTVTTGPRHVVTKRSIAVSATAQHGVASALGPLPGAVNQCNGTDNVGGEAVVCSVTITNNLDVASGLASSTVKVKECHGAANAVPTCTTSTTPYDQLTLTVTQCNGSGSGGGGTVNCTVDVVNNIIAVVTPTPATINQCNGSGNGGGTQPTLSCGPIGNTTGATITQCNASGNGGGATIRVQCTVTPSTQTSALPVTINQCNGSGNGGGATVTCSASVTNNIIAPTSPGGTPGGGGTPPGGGGTPPGGGGTPPGGGGTPPGGGSTPPGGTPAGGTLPVVVIGTPIVPSVGPSGIPAASANGGIVGTPGARAVLTAFGTTLPVTGSDTPAILLVALTAMLLGGLLVLSSRSTSRS